MIAIAGGKGGCGKTTTALGVARALAARGVRVRAVDLDVGMPNLHRLAGVEREPTLADRASTTGDRVGTTGDRAGTTGDRVGTTGDRVGTTGDRAGTTGDHVRPTDGRERTTGDRSGTVDERQHDAAGVEIVPAPRVTAPVDVPDALAALRPAPGVTLLDCPASAGPDGAMPLREASAVLLASTDRAESLEDAAKTGRMARSLDVPVLGAVVTRTDALSERARSTLPTDHVVAVPESDAPLEDPAVRERYGVVAEWLAETSGGAARSRATIAAAPSERGEPSARSARGDERRANGARAIRARASGQRADRHRADARRSDANREDAQRVAANRAADERADGPTTTRRRDRRSRRSPGAAGARSSSRGGGAPSDRT